MTVPATKPGIVTSLHTTHARPEHDPLPSYVHYMYIHPSDHLRFEWDGAKALRDVHCYRDEDRVIRLISARNATRAERADYGARFHT